MDKNRWLIIVALGLFLSMDYCTQAQTLQRPKSGMRNTPARLTPELAAAMQEEGRLSHAAAIDLHAGNYATAEAEAREAHSLIPGDGVPEEVLAAVLERQGKDREALEAYRMMVIDEKAMYPRVLLPYAQLLLKSGQWAQAVVIYDQALPYLPDVGIHPETPIVHDSNFITTISRFSPEVPEPAALAVALHITYGMVLNATPDWAGSGPQNIEAMAEYGEALQLAPNNALANYYYGVGWHELSSAERTKFGHAEQAKAALQKASKIGNAAVKAAAAKALKNAG